MIALAASRPLLDAHGIAASALDEAYFAANPEQCIADLLEHYRPDLVLSGSSPAKGPPPETPEQYLIKVARRRGIVSVAILDYWGLYRQRFCTSGRMADPELLPDQLCVLDIRCQAELLSLGVPMERMHITHNPWLDAMALKTSKPSPHSCRLSAQERTILFISQPLAEFISQRNFGYTQETMLSSLLSALAGVSPGQPATVVIWPHPAENAHRWQELRQYPHKGIKLIVTRDRSRAILAQVDLVVTSHSTLAYEALYHCTPCISFRPGGGRLEPFITNEIGLTKLIESEEQLKLYLAQFDPDREKQKLLTAKARLRQEQMFFSDGRAAERVLAVLEQIPLPLKRAEDVYNLNP